MSKLSQPGVIRQWRSGRCIRSIIQRSYRAPAAGRPVAEINKFTKFHTSNFFVFVAY